MSDLPHTITATWVQDAELGAEVEVAIVYRYVRGAAPIIHPADNADPGWPAEVEFVSATAEFGIEGPLAQKRLDEWAADWLRDEGYSAAVEQAEQDSQPDPDAAYDAMRDDRMTGDW